MIAPQALGAEPHASIARLIKDGGLDVLLTAGTDMLNSFGPGAVERDLSAWV
jgi:hypothetical protein